MKNQGVFESVLTLAAIALLLGLTGCYLIEPENAAQVPTAAAPPSQVSPLKTPKPGMTPPTEVPSPTSWNWFPTATALARITASPLPPAPTPTPRITPTPPVAPAALAAYNPLVPLRAEGITLAAVKPLAESPITFRAWSPTGEQFLFGRTEQRYILVQFKNGAAANGFWYDLWVANADGTNPRKLADFASDAVWSPDGRSVAYTVPAKAQGVEGELYVVDIERLQPHAIAACDLSGMQDLAWLPTDEITCRQNGVMHVVKSDGSQMRRLNNIFTSDFITNTLPNETLPPVFQGYYRISPNGKRIAYLKTGLSPTLWVSNLDGSGAVQIEGRLVSLPSWSPDSNQLAYSVPNGKGRLGTDLWVVNADGSNRRRIVALNNEEVQCQNPAWSPDGKVIAFNTSDLERKPEAVWIVNSDGTGLHLLVDLAFSPQWSARGNEIAVRRKFSMTLEDSDSLLVSLGLDQ